MPIVRKKNLYRLTVNVPKELLEKIKDIAEVKGLTTTQLIVFMMNRYIDEREMTEYLPKLIDVLVTNKDKIENLDV